MTFRPLEGGGISRQGFTPFLTGIVQPHYESVMNGNDNFCEDSGKRETINCVFFAAGNTDIPG